jgi:hypothetical protein
MDPHQEPAEREVADLGEYLARQLITRPELTAAVSRTVAEYAPANRDMSKREALLRARQFLERALRRDCGQEFCRDHYWRAAGMLYQAGLHEDACLLYDLGALDSELRAYRRRWDKRFAARPLTADERRAAVQLASGQVRELGTEQLGVDGAAYTPGAWADLRTGRSCVIVRNSAANAEVVTFEREAEADAWLRDRSRGEDGPLAAAGVGLTSRAVREEQVLAWLMRHPHDGGSSLLVDPGTWTTHLRAVLYTSIRSVWNWDRLTPGPREVFLMYESQLLRAPAWAADDIGWPHARHAVRYFHRLAATRVTAADAYAAALTLASADAAPVASPPVRHFVVADARRVLEVRESPRQPGRQRAPLPAMPPPPMAGHRTPVPSM